jgi:MFS family permease
VQQQPTFDTRSKTVLKVVFLTLFLDLASFSIILPLFPAMLAYYLEQEGTGGLLGVLIGYLERFSHVTGVEGAFGVAVLFGGVLGSLYSLLQFACAPLIGTISDRFGRRPVLLISIAGLAFSYLLWGFAGTFMLLVAARVLGGIMSGNISTATAAVADVTDVRTRSKGMALVGVAFALGFIIGPAMGGLLAQVNLLDYWPSLARFGVNPFSVPALLAFVLSMANLIFVAVRFPETLPPGQRMRRRPWRTANPFRLFKTHDYPGVTRTNLTNFIFLTAFSGMEFSLTFLAHERFGYGPRQNAYMFIVIGLLLAIVQGGYVRRFSALLGPRRITAHGLLLTVPGLAMVGVAWNAATLYVGLILLACGAAMVFPSLTALASLYAPVDEQGRVIGVFRSLGALARAAGPLIACMIYWRLGSEATYYIGAALVLVPLLLTQSLPDPHPEQVTET